MDTFLITHSSCFLVFPKVWHGYRQNCLLRDVLKGHHCLQTCVGGFLLPGHWSQSGESWNLEVSISAVTSVELRWRPPGLKALAFCSLASPAWSLLANYAHIPHTPTGLEPIPTLASTSSQHQAPRLSHSRHWALHSPCSLQFLPVDLFWDTPCSCPSSWCPRPSHSPVAGNEIPTHFVSWHCKTLLLYLHPWSDSSCWLPNHHTHLIIR